MTGLDQSPSNVRFLAMHEIHAIKSDGHYARLLNGRGELFCPWSLSKLEQAVVPAPFMRTHRSFLVNLDHVSCSSDRVRDRAVAAARFLR
jgi:diguanylate cyclase